MSRLCVVLPSCLRPSLTILGFLALLPVVAACAPAQAESPIAASAPAVSGGGATVSSPVTGITLPDSPRLLPVDSRFSQAIQTVGFDVGLTCQQIEAYGWKIDPSEQTRVNSIFTQTAEELARLGYTVTPQNPGSAAADITVYTASRAPGMTGGTVSQDVLFTWSAGKAGLLLLLCDAHPNGEKKGFGPAPGTVPYQGTKPAPDINGVPDNIAARGNPADIIGEWAGTYSCIGQGPAGATLTISRVKADRSGYAATGSFSFYPISTKNPDMVRGSYTLSGRYDPATRRALLEPGRWIQRPSGFSNAPLIAEFDTGDMTRARVSALFQGTTGCTSFEGSYRPGSATRAAGKAYDEAPATTVKAKPKKKIMKKAAPVAAAPAAKAPAPATAAPAPAATDTPADVPGSTAASSPAAAAAPEIAVPTTPADAPVTVPAAPAAGQ